MCRVNERSDFVPFSAGWLSKLYLLLLNSMSKSVDIPAFCIGRTGQAFAASSVALGHYVARICDIWNRKKK